MDGQRRFAVIGTDARGWRRQVGRWPVPGLRWAGRADRAGRLHLTAAAAG